METPNLSYINTMARGDESFVEKIIGVIKGEFYQEIEVYKNNFSDRNFKLAAENVHKIKHKISILGLEKSHVVANNHENNLKEEVHELHGDFMEIVKVIEDYLVTI
ncbi:Hpt domain-containing protein [Seonamhaeicola marinus]|uniref:Hpt domain-containing protein n=1 Tax=Seonamhaeicola marinus TaxID=1912246 RepID=A0A5D0I484_9FLAO|nr:Hpt domain-containing protein [Seonamhaeicola marinus]TYA78476.1 Hpt domain-containing protein [Seonamhaeicola marinus]